MSTIKPCRAGTGRGLRPKPTTMADAFKTKSMIAKSMRCGECRFFAHGWCSIQACGRSSIGFACVYGFNATRSQKVAARAKAKAERRKAGNREGGAE